MGWMLDGPSPAAASLESDGSVGPTSTAASPWWWYVQDTWYLAKLARIYEEELGLNVGRQRRSGPIDYVNVVERRPVTAMHDVPPWAAAVAREEYESAFKTFDTITVRNVMGAENEFILKKHQRLVVWDADGLPVVLLEPPKRRPRLGFMTLQVEGSILSATPPSEALGCLLVYDAAGNMLPHVHSDECGFHWSQYIPPVSCASAPSLVLVAAGIAAAIHAEATRPDGAASDSEDDGGGEEDSDGFPVSPSRRAARRHHDPTQGGIISSTSFDDLVREDSLEGDLEWESDDDSPRRDFSNDEISNFPELFFSPLP